MVAGTSTVNVGRVAFNRCERRIRREARVDRHRGTVLQRRRGLNVETANVGKKRQHREHMIIRDEAVHVLAHHPVSKNKASCRSTAPLGLPVVPEV